MTTPTRRRRPWETRPSANGHHVVVHLTPNAYHYTCTCGTGGPPQPSYALACEDSQQHLDQTGKP